MKVLGNISLFIIGLAVLLFFYGRYSDSKNERAAMLQIEKAARLQVEKLVEDLNRGTPLRMDAVTTLEKIELKDKLIDFEYLSELPLTVFEASETSIEQQLTGEINGCSADLTKGLLSQDYVLRHTYSHTLSEQNIVVTIKPDDCKKFVAADIDVIADYYIENMQNIMPFEFQSGYEWTSVNRDKKTLNATFKYKEKLSNELNLLSLKQFLQTDYTKNVCTNPTQRLLLNNGYKIRTIINDKIGSEFYTYDINVRMC
jgi:hypothetical protein